MIDRMTDNLGFIPPATDVQEDPNKAAGLKLLSEKTPLMNILGQVFFPKDMPSGGLFAQGYLLPEGIDRLNQQLVVGRKYELSLPRQTLPVYLFYPQGHTAENGISTPNGLSITTNDAQRNWCINLNVLGASVIVNQQAEVTRDSVTQNMFTVSCAAESGPQPTQTAKRIFVIGNLDPYQSRLTDSENRPLSAVPMKEIEAVILFPNNVSYRPPADALSGTEPVPDQPKAVDTGLQQLLNEPAKYKEYQALIILKNALPPQTPQNIPTSTTG